jgi:hypothetical protein
MSASAALQLGANGSISLAFSLPTLPPWSEILSGERGRAGGSAAVVRLDSICRWTHAWLALNALAHEISLASCKGRLTSLWLHPSPRHLPLSDLDFQLALRLRLGLPPTNSLPDTCPLPQGHARQFLARTHYPFLRRFLKEFQNILQKTYP